MAMRGNHGNGVSDNAALVLTAATWPLGSRASLSDQPFHHRDSVCRFAVGLPEL